MAEILIDTDVFVDHLRGARRLVPGTDRVSYSVITRAELFAGRGTEETRVTRLLAPFREVAVDRAIAERAGRIRRQTGTSMADALIAATAIEHGLTLTTRNTADYAGIRGLKLRSSAGSRA